MLFCLYIRGGREKLQGFVAGGGMGHAEKRIR